MENLGNELTQSLQIALDRHNSEPNMYYLKEGNPEYVNDCKKVFHLLRQVSRTCYKKFFESKEAIPIHPKFALIKRHIDQIRQYYGPREPALIQKFMQKIIPYNSRPLRKSVLSSVSLFSTRVYLHDASLKPAPVQSYVDGFCHFVINLGENVIRIPLIQDGKAIHELPPSIRFLEKDGKSGESIKKFIINTLPARGRFNQLYAFLSIINRTNPISDFITSFSNALTSYDLTFAIAIAALASETENIDCNRQILQILASHNLADHLFRSLACAVRLTVSGFPTNDNIELTALVNIFIAHSMNWASHVKRTRNCNELLHQIVNDIKNCKISDNSMYLLRTCLTIATYEDPSGSIAIAMLMEIVSRPFALAFDLKDEFITLKETLCRGEEELELRNEVEDAIADILGRTFSLTYISDPKHIDDALHQLYSFVTIKIDKYVELLVAMNSRKKHSQPIIQMMLFAFDKSNKLVK